jgi:murein DD-endopeptidase MepM/ murein hydrolase activator NlpD
MTWHKQVGLILTAVALIGAALPVSAQSNTIPPLAQVSTPAPGVVTIHVVQRGEDMFQIAQKYGTTVDAIAQANGIDNPALIMVGQRLVIPGAVNHPGIPVTYTVGPGDSLPVLAWRFGASIQQIAVQNDIINPALLYVGLPLSLVTVATNAPISNGRVITVQPHDTLFSLANQYGQSPQLIAAVNGLTMALPLYDGQSLAIPANKAEKSTTPLIAAPAVVTKFVMKPATLEQGRSVAIEITTSTPMQLRGTFLNRPVTDRSDDGGLTHTIFIGVNAFTTPGIYPLQLSSADTSGQPVDLSRLIEIDDGGYGSEQIVLPPNLKDLTDPKITQPELDKLAAITSKVTLQRYFNGAFGLPVPATIVSQFGTRRSYDGAPYNQFHSGTDFAGAPGSPIYAPMAGVVVFTGPMQVRGNITIIDHGWGIYTAYCHQTQIMVNVGQTVKAGQVIGTIGATGRVTGPHLHWELYIEGVQVDPMQWARTSFFP